MGSTPRLRNFNVDLQLGTGFFICLTIVLVLLFLWRRVGSDTLSDMLTSSFSPSSGSGRYAVQKN